MKQKYTVWLSIILFISMMFNTGTTLSANSETPTIDKIQASGKLVLGTSADYPPYEFFANVDGEMKEAGFDIEVARLIAQELGVELEVKNMSFDGLLAALQTGTVDVVLSGMQATEERRQSVDFSVSYYKDENVLMTLTENADLYTDINDLQGKNVGGQQASIQETSALNIKDELNGDMKVTSVINLLDAVQMVKNGNLDALIISRKIAEANMKVEPKVAIAEGITLPDKVDGSSVAIAKGQDDLVALINKVLEKNMADGTIDELFVEANILAEAQTNEKVTLWSILQTYWPLLLKGGAVTIIIAFVSVVVGSLGGVLLALMKLSDNKILSAISSVYVDFIRGTPLLIQVYIIFYGLPAVGIRLPALAAGMLAMSINSIAYVSEIIRAGISGVDSGQFEAAASLGMKQSLMLKEIILPQAIKNILPALGNEFITIIKESSILSVITVTDLMFAANTIKGNTFQPFIPFIIVAVLYFILTFGLSKLLSLVEGKLKTNAGN